MSGPVRQGRFRQDPSCASCVAQPPIPSTQVRLYAMRLAQQMLTALAAAPWCHTMGTGILLTIQKP